MTQGPLNLAQSIDHTLLKPNADAKMFENLCKEALTYKFFSVCVPPYWVSFCKSLLKTSSVKNSVKVCTVIGFPLGYTFKKCKELEAKEAIKNGADEIDLVMNISAFLSGDLKLVKSEIKSIRKISAGKVLKVIFETSLLSDRQIISACEIAAECKVDFVKTSTGFEEGGATEHHVKLIRKNISKHMRVKASGGIRDLQTAEKMLSAGATRLGTGAGINIIKGLAATQSPARKSSKGSY